MITIFAAVEQVLVDSVVERSVRMELYTTKEVAAMAIAGWARSDSTNGLAWEWDSQHNRWQRYANERLHVMTVEEHVVLDAPKKDPIIEWVTDLGDTIITDKWIEYPAQPSDCMHDNCPTCKGTGVDAFGKMCVHWLSCPCKKCSVYI